MLLGKVGLASAFEIPLAFPSKYLHRSATHPHPTPPPSSAPIVWAALVLTLGLGLLLVFYLPAKKPTSNPSYRVTAYKTWTGLPCYWPPPQTPWLPLSFLSQGLCITALPQICHFINGSGPPLKFTHPDLATCLIKIFTCVYFYYLSPLLHLHHLNSV